MKISQPIFEICSVPYRFEVKDPSHWIEDTSRQEKFGVHKATQCIKLRWRRQDCPLIEQYQDQLDQIFETLRGYYEFVDYCAVIANLPAGESITKHRDSKAFNQCHRIHLPIKTNPDVWFSCGREVINMKEGTFYEISNTNCVHGVENKSSEDRYHYIIDLFPKPVEN